MTKPTLTLNDFIVKAAADPKFLGTYLKDPLRIKDRFDVDDALITKLSSLENLMETLTAENPQHIAAIHRSLLATNSADSFGDAFTDRGFKDSFKDGAGFTDRHRDNG